MILDSIRTSITAIQSVTGSAEGRSTSNVRVVYASSPVTTGQRMYGLFRKYRARSVEELKGVNPDIFSRDIMKPNLADGESFADNLRSVSTYRYVICPATFFAKGWLQEHYMAFWKSVIERFADDIRFNGKWWWSNGCAEEFLIGARSGKTLYEGFSARPIDPREALRKISRVIAAVGRLGADASKLQSVHSELAALIKGEQNS